jgi:hypothetical protein
MTGETDQRARRSPGASSLCAATRLGKRTALCGGQVSGLPAVGSGSVGLHVLYRLNCVGKKRGRSCACEGINTYVRGEVAD